MKKIIMVSHSSAGRGAETVFLKTYSCLASNYEVSVYMPNNNGYLYDRVKAIGGHVYVGSNKLLQISAIKSLVNFVIYNLPAILKICSLIYLKKIDVVYSSTIINYIGAFSAILMGKKHIWHIHEMHHPRHIWISESYKGLFRFLFKKSELIFVANGVKESWLTYFELKECDVNCNVVFNPIKTIELKERLPRTDIKIGFAGSYGAIKNIDTFVDVMVDIINEYQNVKMCAVGYKIEENINRLINGRLKESSYFLSDHVEIDSFMNDIDVLVLPSFSESWGLVVFEAMSTGVIPIVTNATALKEILIDGVNVFYIDPNSKHDIFLKIKNILDEFSIQKQLITQNNFKFIKENRFNENFEKNISKIFSCD